MRFRSIAATLRSVRVQLVALVLPLLVSGIAVADTISFAGAFRYTIFGGQVVLAVPPIQSNYPAGVRSGPLLLEFRATTTPVTTEQTQAPYVLASATVFNRLAGGELRAAFNTEAVTFTPPPDGLWYLSLWLYEKGNGVHLRDITAMTNPVAFGNVAAPPDPDLRSVLVVEYYSASRDHYFMTADGAEILALDGSPEWTRTGYSFRALSPAIPALPGTARVCRFYGNPARGLDSHFFSAAAAECSLVAQLYPGIWLFESSNVFQVWLPDPLTGACPAATVPIYRAFNNRADANHRYTAYPAVQALMVAKGYSAEGYGDPPVVMCGVQ